MTMVFVHKSVVGKTKINSCPMRFFLFMFSSKMIAVGKR